MTDNEKKILQKAMKQIEVPQEEALRALEMRSSQRKNKFSKVRHSWGELILSGVVIVCLIFSGVILWPKAKETSKPSSSNVTSSSTEQTKEISGNIFQSVKYWKVKGEENYYSFSSNKVRVIVQYFTQMTPRYLFKDGQLELIYDSLDDNDNPIDEIHSYKVSQQGKNLLLEPKLSDDEKLILEPHNEEIFPYTEETIKKLQPAVNPDLTMYASWTSSIKGNRQNSTLIFDGFIMKELIDEEDKWMTWTYEIKDNHLLINYGSYTASQDMYWDGENIVLWTLSNSLPKYDDQEEYKEETVTIFKPNK